MLRKSLSTIARQTTSSNVRLFHSPTRPLTKIPKTSALTLKNPLLKTPSRQFFFTFYNSENPKMLNLLCVGLLFGGIIAYDFHLEFPLKEAMNALGFNSSEQDSIKKIISAHGFSYIWYRNTSNETSPEKAREWLTMVISTMLEDCNKPKSQMLTLTDKNKTAFYEGACALNPEFSKYELNEKLHKDVITELHNIITKKNVAFLQEGQHLIPKKRS